MRKDITTKDEFASIFLVGPKVTHEQELLHEEKWLKHHIIKDIEKLANDSVKQEILDIMERALIKEGGLKERIKWLNKFYNIMGYLTFHYLP